MRNDILGLMFIIFGIIAFAAAGGVALIIVGVVLYALYHAVIYSYHAINNLYWNKVRGEKSMQQIRKEIKERIKLREEARERELLQTLDE